MGTPWDRDVIESMGIHWNCDVIVAMGTHWNRDVTVFMGTHWSRAVVFSMATRRGDSISMVNCRCDDVMRSLPSCTIQCTVVIAYNT